MKQFLLVMVTMFFSLLALPAVAQVDWDQIGRPVSDDTRDVYDRYVYFDEDKTVDPNVPLSHPLVSREDLARWLMEQIPQMMTLSSRDYRQKVIQNKRYFTERGIGGLAQFLNEEGVVANLDAGQNSVTTIVEARPDIIADDVLNNIYYWEVNIPIMMSYRMANNVAQKVMINAKIIRVPFGKNPDGLAFDSWRVVRAVNPADVLSSDNNDGLSDDREMD